MEKINNLYSALLHEKMLNKNQEIVTTSLTMMDIHDLARSAVVFGINTFYIAHPAKGLRELAFILQNHWSEGFGSLYNPDRKEAIKRTKIVPTYKDITVDIKKEREDTPFLIATTAKKLNNQITFKEAARITQKRPVLVALGTGHGMSQELIEEFDAVLQPIEGYSRYNHLSVRSAGALIFYLLNKEISNLKYE